MNTEDKIVFDNGELVAIARTADGKTKIVVSSKENMGVYVIIEKFGAHGQLMMTVNPESKPFLDIYPSTNVVILGPSRMVHRRSPKLRNVDRDL
jgi:hypothetical protein